MKIKEYNMAESARTARPTHYLSLEGLIYNTTELQQILEVENSTEHLESCVSLPAS